MLKNFLCLAAFFGWAGALSAADHTLHSFKKIQLTDQFWAEGANFGDFNKDGHNDVVAGPYWWEGPDFKKRHEYYPATKSFKHKKADGIEETIPGFEGALGEKNAYSDNFFAFTQDINQDGWTDILIYGFPGLDASWFENPKGQERPWPRHKVLDVVDNESPTWGDLDGDGRNEIICNSGGYFGYATPDWKQPETKWTWHSISPKGDWQRFTHGLGFGDVNGDGRRDVLHAGGWWEQPASLGGEWVHHPEKFGGGGAQMYTYDVNGDGLNDVITSLEAHGYGLVWFEQVKKGNAISFTQHAITGKKPDDSPYGVVFSQLHAIDLVDMDKDGLKDIVTGKRFWAHGSEGDAEPNAPAVLYWFQLVRGADGRADYVPHQIDTDSGIGTQVVAGDVNGDGWPDVVVGNKKGVFVHLHQVKQVSAEEWRRAQPQPRKEPAAAGATGMLPSGDNGRPLNLDFETGTLQDWKATGTAFTGQPVEGDTVHKRRADMTSNHQGRFWIGTYERDGDGPHGELTSVPFKVTEPYAAFLVGGGPYERTRVELVDAGNKKVLFKISGYDADEFKKVNNASETMRHVIVDLRPHQGREIFVRVVDDQDGHWGHINFDDFKFYAARPVFGDEVAAGRKALVDDMPAPDVYKYAGLSPLDAAKDMTLPPGFSAHLFAGEPDVKQPIAFALDDRARVWVVEAFSYPQRQPEGQGKDRILIFEDTNGDGAFDRRTVFKEGLNLVSGLAVGFGGVWVGAAPQLLFIPDRNRDDQPDGEPEVVLDGWAWQDTHETLNTFLWGPDGWLYGCHGVFTQSKVGPPGTPEAQRTPINAGVWRYHPTKKQFEVFAEGTSNPWGIDFDANGQCFIEACVIPHLFHVIQGARYQRQAGSHFNPYVYDDIKTIADHVHYAGDKGPHAGNNRSDAAGGGHAHAGLLIYQGHSWPKEYDGKIFMNNIHGQRINMDIPERTASGFVGHHGPDFINFNDRWSQVINLLTDQDGSLFMIDWYDANQCHHNRVDGHDRSNGRIFKVVYNHQPWTAVDLQKKTSAELVQLQLNPNEWYVRHARRILQERGPNPAVHQALEKILHDNQNPSARLRALWALHATGGLDEKTALALLDDTNEYLRAWSIQFLAEDKSVSEEALQLFAKLARQDPSPVVRLYLASALQRVPPARRLDPLKGLLAHAEDGGDHNLPLMYWYAAEPLAGQDVKSAAQLLATAKIPRLREFVTRRMTAGKTTAQAKK